jgi:hypothetical protein
MRRLLTKENVFCMGATLAFMIVIWALATGAVSSLADIVKVHVTVTQA